MPTRFWHPATLGYAEHEAKGVLAEQRLGEPLTELLVPRRHTRAAPFKLKEMSIQFSSFRALALVGATLAASSLALAAPGYRRAPQVNPALNRYSVPPPPASFQVSARPRVVFNTSKGAITLELNKSAAPLHVKSFVYLAKRGFYNGVRFHRYADLTGSGGFIIQGGDPATKSPATAGFAGGGGPGYEIPLEISSLKHDKLSIAAARTSDPNSAGSQFYICQAPVHFLDGQYTVFGRVVGGQNAALALRQGDVIKSARVIR